VQGMATTVDPPALDASLPSETPPRRRRVWPWVVGGLLLLIVGGAVAAAAYVRTQFPSTRLAAAPQTLAHVQTSGWGTKILSVRATADDGSSIPVRTSAKGWISPKGTLKPGQRIHIAVAVERPSWAKRLVGATEHQNIVVTAPAVKVLTHWIQTRHGKPVQVRFSMPVRSVTVWRGDKVAKQRLARPHRVVSLPRSLTSTDSGSIRVAAAARTWETASAPVRVTWFPTGQPLAAVLQPALGKSLLPKQSLTLRFSRPLTSVLGSGTPKLTPAVPGTWKTVDDHTMTFQPTDAGFTLGHTFSVQLPKPATVTTKKGLAARSVLQWHVPDASQDRLEQLLAQFGYMPLTFVTKTKIPTDADSQLTAAVVPPEGHWTWRWKKTPKPLQALWTPGVPNKIDQGALMKFQNEHGLSPNGVATPETWNALLAAATAGKHAPAHYSYVEVAQHTPEVMKLWKDGKVVVTGAANTGISSAPTPNGTWPVYSHIAVGTMSGLNPDGTPYHDPGIPWISYFNGGDALHAFPRGSYGSPQSLGCVELQLDTAKKIWPSTPIGTLVTVHV
jgi:peptidoglycan hydrolase-like protein with peptidoglycan-binding domain